MSYCRFSSLDFQCDVYVYEDCNGGYTTHVASKRPVLDVELPPVVDFTPETVKAWFARDAAVMKWVKSARLEPIGLPHDGECFNDPTPEDAARRLKKLKELGYIVPDYAIEALMEESVEQP